MTINVMINGTFPNSKFENSCMTGLKLVLKGFHSPLWCLRTKFQNLIKMNLHIGTNSGFGSFQRLVANLISQHGIYSSHSHSSAQLTKPLYTFLVHKTSFTYSLTNTLHNHNLSFTSEVTHTHIHTQIQMLGSCVSVWSRSPVTDQSGGR